MLWLLCKVVCSLVLHSLQWVLLLLPLLLSLPLLLLVVQQLHSLQHSLLLLLLMVEVQTIFHSNNFEMAINTKPRATALGLVLVGLSAHYKTLAKL